MGRRRNDRNGGSTPPTDWDSERTLAAAEEEPGFGAAEDEGAAPANDTSCSCGSNEFLLEAFLHVVDGIPRAEAVEVELLTCPQCGREYEAIQGEGGRILRGDFVGYTELDE